jgi:hypothetical protein
MRLAELAEQENVDFKPRIACAGTCRDNSRNTSGPDRHANAPVSITKIPIHREYRICFGTVRVDKCFKTGHNKNSICSNCISLLFR